MTALLPAHRRAEKFASLVDATSPGAPGRREVRLLEVVGALRLAAEDAPVPRADYVADLRARLMAEAETALVPTDRRLLLPDRRRTTRPHRLGAAAAALALVGGTAGMSVAARGSLPGDSLYPLKRGLEHVGEAFSFSDAARGEDLLHHAQVRLTEIRPMLDEGAPDSAVAADLQSFGSSAGQGAALLFADYRRNGDDTSVSTVRDFAGTGMGDLTALAKGAPRPLQAEFARAARMLADLDQQASALCGECGAREPLSVPDDLALASSDGALDRLLDVPGQAPGRAAGGSTAGAGPSPGSGPSAGATTGAPAVTLPDLTGLLGGSPAGAGGGTPDGSAGVGAGNPLGGVLGTPGSGSSSGVDLGKVGKDLGKQVDQAGKDATAGVGKVTDGVTGGVGKVTDPLPKP